VWTEGRKEALTGAQYRSPLSRRPYDLRHAAVSLWLNSGVPATEVARRAGHGVAVLLKIYAHCIDGQADAANKRITDALGVQDTPTGETIAVAVRTGDGAAGSESLAGVRFGRTPESVPLQAGGEVWACPGWGYVTGSAVQPAIVRLGWCRRVLRRR
jgi:hypothetical protein